MSRMMSTCSVVGQQIPAIGSLTFPSRPFMLTPIPKSLLYIVCPIDTIVGIRYVLTQRKEDSMERRKRERWMWLVLMAAVLALAAGAELAQAQLPDLVVTLVNGPDTGNIGGLRPTIEVSVTVTNNGSNAGAFRLGFYYSTDSAVDPTVDIFSGYSCSFDSGITAGQTTTCSGKIGAPRSLAPGTYYLGACADDTNEVAENNETNNCKADSAPIVLGKNSRR